MGFQFMTLLVKSLMTDAVSRQPRIVFSGTPVSLDASAHVIFFPETITNALFLRLLPCTAYEAQRQLLGSYPKFGSILSMVIRGLGLRPMSARNASKEASHVAQTFIPLPPYKG